MEGGLGCWMLDGGGVGKRRGMKLFIYLCNWGLSLFSCRYFFFFSPFFPFFVVVVFGALKVSFEMGILVF